MPFSVSVMWAQGLGDLCLDLGRQVKKATKHVKNTHSCTCTHAQVGVCAH